MSKIKLLVKLIIFASIGLAFFQIISPYLGHSNPFNPKDKDTAANKLYKATADLKAPNHAVILLYHHIDDHTPALTSTSPKAFEQQLNYLADNDFQVWPLIKIIDHLTNNKNMPDKVVAISFDDSYQSIYNTAFPLLSKRGWPFTIFVSTDAIDQDYQLQTSWEQLREMTAKGATIGNHSSSHKHLLKQLPNESHLEWQRRISLDIAKAEQRIIEEIGVSNKLFAYPYGENNKALRQLVSELGYIAFGQQSGPVGYHSDLSNLPRFTLSGDYADMEGFTLKVMTVPMATKIKADDNPLNHDNNKPRLELSLISPLVHAESLRCFGSLQGRLKLQWNNSEVVMISPEKMIPTGRSRYNCTAIFSEDGNGNTRYYWFSHAWIRLDKNQQWID
jgi:peptidoglycan/xylan/chitin deacetylase (PgdA/CDA1 family)